MRTTTLFFILGLVAFTSANTNVLVQMEQHPFGAAMLDLVQLNLQSNSQAEMKSEDSYSAITQLLNQIQEDMKTAKTNGDNDHRDYQSKADADIIQYKKVIKEQKERLVETQKQLAADRKNLAQTEKDLIAARKELVVIKQKIVAADEANRVAIIAYNKKVKELTEAIAACKEANVELAKLTTESFVEGQSINMLEIRGGMEKVKTALALHMPARLAVYRPIIQALVDMGTNADPALVQKVMGLITELQTALALELSQSKKNEVTRINDYTNLRADLVKDQAQTEQRIGRYESNIKSLKYNITQNEAVEAGLKKTIPQQEELLKIREQQKAEEQTQYDEDDASRTAELKVIKELIGFFETKVNSASAYMKSRTASAGTA